MNPKTRKIAEELRKQIESRYPIRQFLVFGSSARGDERWDSDIDVWVCLPRLDRGIEEELFDMAYDLELKYDCLIDLIAVSEKDLEGRIGKAPIRKCILEEGVEV